MSLLFHVPFTKFHVSFTKFHWKEIESGDWEVHECSHVSFIPCLFYQVSCLFYQVSLTKDWVWRLRDTWVQPCLFYSMSLLPSFMSLLPSFIEKRLRLAIVRYMSAADCIWCFIAFLYPQISILFRFIHVIYPQIISFHLLSNLHGSMTSILKSFHLFSNHFIYPQIMSSIFKSFHLFWNHVIYSQIISSILKSHWFHFISSILKPQLLISFSRSLFPSFIEKRLRVEIKIEIEWHCTCHRMQCVAVCCSVLQCVAVIEIEWHCTCHRLQCVAVCCSVLQCVAVCCSDWDWMTLHMPPVAQLIACGVSITPILQSQSLWSLFNGTW